jgi:hypothetical protein
LAKKTFLDFEQPIAELETKIEELRYVQNESAVDISEEIDQLSKKSQQLTKDIYSDLTPWQITKIARHPERPYTLDYVRESSPTSSSCTATATLPTTSPSSAAWRASTATPAWCWATRRAATPRSAPRATSA